MYIHVYTHIYIYKRNVFMFIDVCRGGAISARGDNPHVDWQRRLDAAQQVCEYKTVKYKTVDIRQSSIRHI